MARTEPLPASRWRRVSGCCNTAALLAAEAVGVSPRVGFKNFAAASGGIIVGNHHVSVAGQQWRQYAIQTLSDVGRMVVDEHDRAQGRLIYCTSR